MGPQADLTSPSPRFHPHGGRNLPQQKEEDSPKTQGMVGTVSAIKNFLITVCTVLFSHYYCTLNRLQDSVNASVTCAENLKNACDWLHCGRLEPNLQWLPVACRWPLPAGASRCPWGRIPTTRGADPLRVPHSPRAGQPLWPHMLLSP